MVLSVYMQLVCNQDAMQSFLTLFTWSIFQMKKLKLLLKKKMRLKMKQELLFSLKLIIKKKMLIYSTSICFGTVKTIQTTVRTLECAHKETVSIFVKEQLFQMKILSHVNVVSIFVLNVIIQKIICQQIVNKYKTGLKKRQITVVILIGLKLIQNHVQVAKIQLKRTKGVCI